MPRRSRPAMAATAFTAVAVLALAIGALGSPPAAAKTPPFEIEVATDDPRAGEPIRVVVRVLGDPGFDPDDLGGLLAVFPESQVVDGRPVPGEAGLALPLRRTEPGTYEGEVTIAFAGEWLIVPFPTERRAISDEYPAPVPLSVGVGSPFGLPKGTAPFVVLLAACAAAIALGVRRRRRQASSALDATIS